MELTIQEGQALYFDADALIAAPRQIYRIDNHKSGRLYFTLTEDPNLPARFYLSVTEMISKTTPTSPWLIKWISDMGYEAAEQYKNERASYGTFMHMIFQEYLIDKEFDLQSIDERIPGYLQECKHPANLANSWINDLKQDIIGFAEFVRAHNVKPLAIELVLASDEMGVAGMMDLYCEMDVEVNGFFGEVFKSGARAGQEKETKKQIRTKALLDFKSGRKGIYDSHAIQLEAYRRLLLENFPQLQGEDIMLFNYCPNDWRLNPGYTLKDQTENPVIRKFDHLIEIGRIESGRIKTEYTQYEGLLQFGEDPKECIINYDLHHKALEYASKDSESDEEQ